MGAAMARDIQQVYDECTGQLAAFARQAGFSECVIGLSGGLDSSVAAPLCAHVFGPDKVHGVLMPGPYSSEHSVTDAQQLADALGIDVRMISIKEPYEAFAQVLAPSCGGSFGGIASENTQARCRMVVLMALSNSYGWMLVNTGNRTEAYMGYSTLYGDTAGAFAPLGCLLKQRVYELGHYINDRACAQGATPPIPENVFLKPPSAELAPDQVDEQGLGIDYPTLDAILEAYFDQGLSVDELVAHGFDAGQVDHVLSTVARNQFKRAYLPPCPTL